jgi:hypothetical protein
MAEHFGMAPRIDFPVTGMNYELSGSPGTLVDEQNPQRTEAPT